MRRAVDGSLLHKVSGRVVEYNAVGDHCFHVLLFPRRSRTRNPEVFVDRKLCLAD